MTRSYHRRFVLALCLIATAGSQAIADEPSAFANSADDAVPTTLAADAYYSDATSENAAGVAFEASEIREFSPTWTVRVGAVVLKRQADPPRTLASNLSSTTTLMDSSWLQYAAQAGPEVGIVRRFETFDVEFRYFQVDEFVAGAADNYLEIVPGARAEGFAAFAGPHSAYFGVGTGGLVTSAAEHSQLRNFELNVRRDVTTYLTFVAGYRHIDLTERIIGQFSSFGVHSDVFSIQGYNHLDGFQLGGETVLWRPGAGRFRLEGSAKVGVFGDATSNYGNFDALVATSTGAHAALMTEWSVTAVYQITPQIAARVGYQGLLLDGVALASEQIGVLNPAAHTGAVENSGTPIYQGLVANLEYAW